MALVENENRLRQAVRNIGRCVGHVGESKPEGQKSGGIKSRGQRDPSFDGDVLRTARGPELRGRFGNLAEGLWFGVCCGFWTAVLMAVICIPATTSPTRHSFSPELGCVDLSQQMTTIPGPESTAHAIVIIVEILHLGKAYRVVPDRRA